MIKIFDAGDWFVIEKVSENIDLPISAANCKKSNPGKCLSSIVKSQRSLDIEDVSHTSTDDAEETESMATEEPLSEEEEEDEIFEEKSTDKTSHSWRVTVHNNSGISTLDSKQLVFDYLYCSFLVNSVLEV